ncbi:hypothetical protein TNCV_4855281, partial [Trichonephila clavipes]
MRSYQGELKLLWAVGSLVARASDSRPEGMGSMPVPPNTLRVHTRSTCSLNQGV